MVKYLIAVALLVSLAGAAKAGIVEGIVSCGGVGKLGDVHLSDCDMVPCVLIPGTTYDVEVYFSASRTSNFLNLYVYRIINNTLVYLFFVPINGEIEEGLEYVLAFKLPVDSTLPGRSDLRFAIINAEPQSTEICAEAAVIVRA